MGRKSARTSKAQLLEEQGRQIEELKSQLEELSLRNASRAATPTAPAAASSPIIPASATPSQRPNFTPPPFDGRGDFREFKSVFQDAIAVNGWSSEATKSSWLRISLRGTARSVIHTSNDTYNEMMERLEARFGDVMKQTMYEQLLPARRRRSQEPLHILADDIRKMCAVVYADLPPRTQEVMAIRHFGMALNDGAAQYELTTQQPRTLEEAVQLITTRETYLRQGARSVHQLQSQHNAGPQEDNIYSMVQQIWNKLHTGEPRTPTPPHHMSQNSQHTPWNSPQNRPLNQLVCPVCGGPHPIYVCRPCRHCGGRHFNKDCSKNLNGSATGVKSSTATGTAQQ